MLRPANWWDDIGFAHQDAYSNALAYHAFLGMAEMARRAGRPDDDQLYASRAVKLRSVYFETFYNPATGVLAGWRSADGKLHDYYFVFVNSVAIVYGLVPPDKANQIMDRLLAKMKEVDYTNFEYGLPGNLVPIRREDYAHHILSSGGGEKEDGSDGFQIYQNGGATASSAYFTLQALYQLGRHKEADAMLFPLLRGFENGVVSGFWSEWQELSTGKRGTERPTATKVCSWTDTKRYWQFHRVNIPAWACHRRTTYGQNCKRGATKFRRGTTIAFVVLCAR